VYKFIISIFEVYSNIHKTVLCSVTKYFAWLLDKHTDYLKKCFSFSFEVLGCQLENVEMNPIKLSISCFRHHSEKFNYVIMLDRAHTSVHKYI
jgi:hypothetical protein